MAVMAPLVVMMRPVAMAVVSARMPLPSSDAMAASARMRRMPAP